MKTTPHWIDGIADVGVWPRLPANEAKHVRFGNLATVIAGVFSFVFLLLELPLILDWGVWEAKPIAIAVGRALAVLPFALPLWLNHRHRFVASRFFLLGWGILFIAGLTLMFGAQVPTQLFFLPLVIAALALFPKDHHRSLFWVVGTLLIGLIGIMALRAWDQPLVPVQSPTIRLIMDESLSVGSVLLTLLVAIVLRTTTIRAERQAMWEQERADRLLLNILPPTIAERLKDETKTIADGVTEATVLFADVVGFTSLSETMTPHQTLELMDQIFCRFDDKLDQFGLEKIKTIGDAYMLAGGLPEPTADHAQAVADMALCMLEEMKHVRLPNGGTLQLRVGISTGPVVAGVIGRKKFLYDLWGDTVNTASRMESMGEPGRIQVSERTYQCLAKMFRFTERGSIEIKGKGSMPTWFLEGRLA